MGTGDKRNLGKDFPASRGAKISFLAGQAAGNAPLRETFGNSSHGGRAKHRQIKVSPEAGARMSKFLRKPEAILWILSISQAAAMLAFNVVLRAAVS
jgi:hypothetical protein